MITAEGPLPSRALSDVVDGKAEDAGGPGLAVKDDNAARRRDWRRAAGIGPLGGDH